MLQEMLELDKTKIFKVKCDTCPKEKFFSMTEDKIKEIAKVISHKDNDGKDCNGKLSYDEIEIEYIMRTCWRLHWDKCENGETRYTRSKINIGLPMEVISKRKEIAGTIFLKRNDKDSFTTERAWIGYVNNFNIREATTSDGKKFNQLWFGVHILGEIIVPDKYKDCMDDTWEKVRPKIDSKQKTIDDMWE